MEEQSKTECQTGIYLITHISSGCVYIGKTWDTFGARFYSHQRRLNLGNHTNRRLQNDWNNYGHLAFSFSVHSYIPRGDMRFEEFKKFLLFREARVTELYPSNYNQEVPGAEKLVVSDETKLITGYRTRQRWADPVQREHLLSVTQTPEINAIRSAASQEYWSDPAVRQAQTEKNYKMHADPEFKEKHRASVKAAHTAPGGFEKYSTAMAKGWVKRKANMAKPEYQAKEAERCQKISETKRRKKEEKLKAMQLSSVSSDTFQSQQ